jgi:hypothetical protein
MDKGGSFLWGGGKVRMRERKRLMLGGDVLFPPPPLLGTATALV